MEEGEKYKIDHQGSLGLLALGAQGVKAWRELRDSVERENQQNEED